jgi:hypothetical protein
MITVLAGMTEVPPIWTIGWPTSLRVNAAGPAMTVDPLAVPESCAGGVTRLGSEKTMPVPACGAGADSVTLLQVVAPAGQLEPKPVIVVPPEIKAWPSISKIGWLKSAFVKNAVLDVRVLSDPELIVPS